LSASNANWVFFQRDATPLQLQLFNLINMFLRRAYYICLACINLKAINDGALALRTVINN